MYLKIGHIHINTYNRWGLYFKLMREVVFVHAEFFYDKNKNNGRVYTGIEFEILNFGIKVSWEK